MGLGLEAGKTLLAGDTALRAWRHNGARLEKRRRGELFIGYEKRFVKNDRYHITEPAKLLYLTCFL
jgi:hypothetical protein